MILFAALFQQPFGRWQEESHITKVLPDFYDQLDFLVTQFEDEGVGLTAVL